MNKMVKNLKTVFGGAWPIVGFVTWVVFGWIPIKEGFLFYNLVDPKSPHVKLIVILIHLGSIFLFLTILFLVSFWKATKKIEKIDSGHFDSPHYLCELDGRHFGLIRLIHTSTTTIADDFSAEVFFDTKIKSLTQNLSCIEHYSSIPSRSPTVVDVMKVDAKTRKESKVNIIPVISHQTPHELFWVLNFVPPLMEGGVLSYNYTQTVPAHGFLKKEEELAKRNLKFDFTSDHIKYPTEYFVTTVIFPKGFLPQNLCFDVWMGDGRLRHETEFIRVYQQQWFRSDYNDQGRLYMRLEVKHPIHGLLYVLCWTPPS